jgi:hypothetical protein
MFRRLLALLGIVTPGPCQPLAVKRPVGEVEWCRRICVALNAAGRRTVVEYTLDDGARVDLLLDNYAVEADWACKWAESIGQALYYGAKTRRYSVCLLFVEDEGDAAFVRRCYTVTQRNLPHMEVWIFDVASRTLSAPGHPTLAVP